MKTCAICGKPHRYYISLSIDYHVKEVCPTCFFLCAPTCNQLSSIVKPKEIKAYSDYPELDMCLYDKLRTKYAFAFPKEDLDDDYYDDIKDSSSKKKDKNQLKLATEIWPDTPFEGREKEISELYDVISRKTKRNAVVIGPSGVGKTALVAHVAWQIKNGKAPKSLAGKKIYVLDVDKLMAGAKYRGDLEDRIGKLIREVESDRNAILFVDEMQSFSKGHSEVESTSVGDILKPYLSTDKIQVIGTTTVDDYRSYIESDPSLNRRFQPVTLQEEKAEMVTPILNALVPGFEKFHNLVIPQNVVTNCVKYADKYIKYRAFPDKAIDLLDMACARKKNRINGSQTNPSHKTVEEMLEEAKPMLAKIPPSIDIIGALYGTSHHKSVAECSLYLQKKEDERCKDCPSTGAQLTNADLAEVVEMWTKIPVNMMTDSHKKQLKALSPEIKSSIIGQDEAVDKVVSTVCRRRLGITKSTRPASFIFVGETGIGKTELAKALAKSIFGSEDNLIRFDMSEYMEQHSVAKLIGAPPGYVGFNEAGQLTEALKRKPFSVVLFDEIEKAHADVSNILLQVLDDGRITDAKGSTVDASNAIIILTSNVGATLTKGVGFGKSESESSKESFEKGLKNHFRPEFLGRVDDVIFFNKLTDSDYEKIAEIHLNKLKSNLSESGINLTYEESVPTLICKKADTAKYHAREIKRTVAKEIENLITDKLLDTEEEVQEIHLFADGDCFCTSLGEAITCI